MAFRSEELAQHSRAQVFERDNRLLVAANADLTRRLECWRHTGREENDIRLSQSVDRVWRGLLWTVPIVLVLVVVASLSMGVLHFGGPNLSFNGLRNVLWSLEHEPLSQVVFGVIGVMSLFGVVAFLAAPAVAMAVRSRLPWSLSAATLFCLMLLWVPTSWVVLVRIQELRAALRYTTIPRTAEFAAA